MRYIFLLVTLLLPHIGTSQPIPDFSHRTVIKEIKKAFEIEQYSVTELKTTKPAPKTYINNFATVLGLNGTPHGSVYLNRVYSCRASTCSIPDKSGSEFFDYIIVFNQNGEIKSVRVINYAASHGQQIASQGWLRQFNGFKGDGENKQVGKNVDAISGATVSANAITSDINDATRILRELTGK